MVLPAILQFTSGYDKDGDGASKASEFYDKATEIYAHYDKLDGDENGMITGAGLAAMKRDGVPVGDDVKGITYRGASFNGVPMIPCAHMLSWWEAAGGTVKDGQMVGSVSKENWFKRYDTPKVPFKQLP